jgi:glycosyltransferase involved in cell wall biosynthesis
MESTQLLSWKSWVDLEPPWQATSLDIVKILFLAGSLEPGKDGVGDYTRTLADECDRLGHQTLLASVNDPWVNVPTAPLKSDPVLRLGSQVPLAERVKAVRRFVAENQPDVVSLQFVPYAFHRSGLPFAWPRMLRAMIDAVPAQIMFHEIWIGAYRHAPLKNRVIGFLQRKIVQALVKSLNCRALHTSTGVYVRLLSNQGIRARHLPLFGNVPIAPPENSRQARDHVLRLGMFGSIHPEWSPHELIVQLRKLGRSIQLAHIGRIGPGESIWIDLTRQYGSEIEVRRLGEQSLTGISRFFFSVDFGIATTPLSLIGKSGCVAAMLDHGLPVIVTRDDIHFAGISETELSSDLLIPMGENLVSRLSSVRSRSPQARLPQVAAQFLNDIGA